MSDFSKERQSELRKKIQDEEKAREREIAEQRNRQKTAYEAQFKTEKILCQACRYTGTITARERESGATYSFRCIYCGAAELVGLHESYPAWEGRHAVRFEILK